MCEFCSEHGEGKEWYLNMQNYNQELLSQEDRQQHIITFFQHFEARTARSLSMLDAIHAIPFVPGIVGRVVTNRQKKTHFGQVIPLEDVDFLLDQVTSIVRLPCACRSLTTGRYDKRYCYGLSIDPTGLIGQFPDFSDHLEWLTSGEAQDAIHKLDKEGLVHSIWTFGTPFIGGLCNCDQDCVAYRLQVTTGMMQIFFPAEYTAQIDWDVCTGCKLCRSQCPFGAIRYSASQDKCFIDADLCYGCGICRAVCKKNAIHLERRKRIFQWHRKSLPASQYRVIVQPCQEARGCHACTDVCPSHVFGILPRSPRANGKRADDWIVQPLLSSRCTNCQACVQACPQGSITVLSA
jgi:ferredoxin